MTDSAARTSDATPAAGRPAARVLLVGWDGADWGVIDPLLAAGRMPNLAKLIAAGARGALAARPPLLSPAVWTSVATGKRPHKHGVVAHAEPRADGRGAKPVGPRTRTCKALWNILTQRGLRCHVIGWPATHPPEQVNGVMVSDRHAPELAGTLEPISYAATVHPPSVAVELAGIYLHARDVDFASLQQLVPLAGKIDQRTDRRLANAAAILAETATLHGAATHVLERHRPWDLAAVHYAGIERFSRAFMAYHLPRMEGVSEADFELYREIVTRAYEFHDLMLGRLLELAGPDATVLLVSGHGYHHGRRRPARPAGDAPEAWAAAWHHGRGVAVLAGPGVRERGGELNAAAVVDVAPTVLALLGVPVGLDMDGRPLPAASGGAATEAREEIFSWDQLPGQAGELPPGGRDAFESASDDSIRHLLALGYVEPPDPDAERAAWQAGRTYALNLARALIVARRPDRAIEVLAPWAEREPDASAILDVYAEAHYHAGRGEEARRLIDRVLQRGGEVPLAHLGLGVLDLAAGRTAAALEHLRHAERQAGGHPAALPALHAAVGRAYAQMRRWPDAERSFRTALELDPDDATTLDDLAAACLAQGRHAEAADLARQAAALERGSALPHYHLGIALLALGAPAGDAEAAFRAALAADANLLGAHRRLAELYAGPLYDPRRQRQHESRVHEILLARRAQGHRDESEE